MINTQEGMLNYIESLVQGQEDNSEWEDILRKQEQGVYSFEETKERLDAVDWDKYSRHIVGAYWSMVFNDHRLKGDR
jgi:hypothetical protein